MSDTGIQIDDFINNEIIKPAGTSSIITILNTPKPRIETKSESTECITRIKSSAWYSFKPKRHKAKLSRCRIQATTRWIKQKNESIML